MPCRQENLSPLSARLSARCRSCPCCFAIRTNRCAPAAKAGGVFFKALAEARDGRPVGLNASNIGCGGGKFYTGFSPMPEFVPQFVSLKERYKQTPEMVLDFIAALDLRPGPKAWLSSCVWMRRGRSTGRKACYSSLRQTSWRGS